MNQNDFCVLTAAASKSVRMIALALALDAKGASERPGNNQGAIVRAVMGGADGVECQWCAGFATRCYILAAQMLAQPNPFTGLDNRFSSSALYRWAQKQGKLTDKPRNGDLFLVKGGKTGHKHTGMIAETYPTTIKTIEGNISDKVVQREIDRANLDFIRVAD